jgi:hypothetical protein
VDVGGTQRQAIEQNRPQLRTPEGELRDAFGPAPAPRDQIIAWLALDPMEYDLVPDVAAPYADAAAA